MKVSLVLVLLFLPSHLDCLGRCSFEIHALSGSYSGSHTTLCESVRGVHQVINVGTESTPRRLKSERRCAVCSEEEKLLKLLTCVSLMETKKFDWAACVRRLGRFLSECAGSLFLLQSPWPLATSCVGMLTIGRQAECLYCGEFSIVIRL